VIRPRIQQANGEHHESYSHKRKPQAGRQEQDVITREIEQNKNADRAYIDDGVYLLELAQKAVSLYSRQSMQEKRGLLNFVHSNSVWKNGQLIPNYRKPFDLLVVTK
jgi:site-specific DNA recombinase